MSSTFSFTEPNKYTHQITPKIILHIYRSNHAVAILKFTDEMSNEIYIPTGFIVYTKNFQTNQKVILKPIDHIYALCWSDDYQIEYNNEVILNIAPNRTWNITSV
jgi:hypothetical protein